MNPKLNRMVNYINAKYTDDSFTFLQMSGGHIGSNEKKILVKSEKYPDAYIRVICVEDNDGKEYFSDTYLGAKFEDETRAYLKKAVVEEYGENVFFEYNADDLACTEGGSSGTTFEEYVSRVSSGLFIRAAVRVGEITEDEARQALCRMFPDAALQGLIYYIHDDVKLTGEEGSAYIQKLVVDETFDHRLFFAKTGPDSFETWRWR